MEGKGRTLEALSTILGGLGAQNQFTDALATLASMVEIPKGVWTRPLEIK